MKNCVIQAYNQFSRIWKRFDRIGPKNVLLFRQGRVVYRQREVGSQVGNGTGNLHVGIQSRQLVHTKITFKKFI